MLSKYGRLLHYSWRVAARLEFSIVAVLMHLCMDVLCTLPAFKAFVVATAPPCHLGLGQKARSQADLLVVCPQPTQLKVIQHSLKTVSMAFFFKSMNAAAAMTAVLFSAANKPCYWRP